MGNHTINADRVNDLIDRCSREVNDGLLPSCQLAIGFNGEIVVDRTIGDATEDTRYCFFSATKPFVAATIWQLVSEELLDLDTAVAALIQSSETTEKGNHPSSGALTHFWVPPRSDGTQGLVIIRKSS